MNFIDDNVGKPVGINEFIGRHEIRPALPCDAGNEVGDRPFVPRWEWVGLSLCLLRNEVGRREQDWKHRRGREQVAAADS